MKALAALLEDVERVHIWRTAKGVQLNVQHINSPGWRVITEPTLAAALTRMFDNN